MKVLLINAGPHKDGKTGKMLRLAYSELVKKNLDVIMINLYDLKLDYCLGCGACIKTKSCINKKDDMEMLTNLFKNSDEIIISAPTYWGNVPASLKNVFDRMFGVAITETKTFPKPNFKGKRYVILTSCNTPMPFAKIFGQSSGMIRATKEFFKTSGMKCRGKVVWSNAINVKAMPKKVERKIIRIVGKIK